MQLIDDLKRRYQDGHLAMKLIYINVAIFIIISIVSGMSSLPMVEWMGLNSDYQNLLVKPWTLFTYMFVHIRFFHLLFNMIMLYIIGEFFYRYFGDRAFAKFYFLGGISGGLLFLLIDLISQQNGLLMGASAAIYSVLFAMVAYQPDLKVRLFFISEPIKLLHVAIGFIALGFLINAENFGGNISHVGGALFGYFYMKKYERGNTVFSNFQQSIQKLFKRKKTEKTYSAHQKPPRDDYEYADWKKQKEDKTNRILEKISRSGYNSLTAAEKEFLFKQGKGK